MLGNELIKNQVLYKKKISQAFKNA